MLVFVKLGLEMDAVFASCGRVIKRRGERVKHRRVRKEKSKGEKMT